MYTSNKITYLICVYRCVKGISSGINSTRCEYNYTVNLKTNKHAN